MYGLVDHRVTDFSPMSTIPTAANAYGSSAYRSSSAGPTGGIGGYAGTGSNHLTSTMGNHVTGGGLSSTLGGIASTDPYGAGVGKYHTTSAYGNGTATGGGVTSSSLYRKY